jgi:L-ascorbate metabolism protein UlaG (beta-lactamase superfamily)
VTYLKPALKIGSKFQNPVPTAIGGARMMLKILPLYLTNREERVPRTPLGPFHTNAATYAKPPASGLRVTWMGHSSLLVELDGVRILIDPMWDERASPISWTGPRRFYAPPLALRDLPPIDAVLISHDHYDHLGAQTVRALATHPALSHAYWVASLGVGAELRRLGMQRAVAELNWTESATVYDAGHTAEVTITALPARHFSGRTLRNRFETLWSSFVLRGSRHTVYYGADSGLWDGFGEIGRVHGPFNLTMLEIGAYNEMWKDIHMGPDGAADAFAALGGGLLMPIHWALFDLALHGWRQPIERMTELADQRGIRLWSPEPGAPMDVVAGQEVRSNWWR